MNDQKDPFKENTGLNLHEQYMKYHPQILSNFEGEMPKIWGRKWKANTTIGKLRVVLVHRPGKEFLSIGKPTPWPPYESSLGVWRMSWQPTNLDELTRDYENLVQAYKDEGVEVIERKPDPNDPPYQVKAIYTDDVCHPVVYGQVILRMYDSIRKGEELPTYQTLAEVGELEFIRHIRRLMPGDGGIFLRSVGDDCLVTESFKQDHILATTDTFVDNIHFTLDYFTLEQIGKRCMAAAVSDIATMTVNSLSGTPV